ncbi:MAG: LacI family DNA-binding transcriptional regulator [Rhodobacteraceae bacterium]|nr:LacI family DNA-binding transcriptional regulator [Paracoccaceae bacterium]
MARRPTMKDVAREAGVSLTTVDRALNGRLTVREETLREISIAAERVGYHARGLIQHRIAEKVPEMKLGFILIKKRHEYYQAFEREIETAVAERHDIRGRAVIRFANSQSPEEFAELMTGLARHVDAIAAVAVNHQKLSQVVRDITSEGTPVFSLLNDFAQGIRYSYLGLNNMKIGRLAAWMLTHTVSTPGKLGIFVGGNRWHGHDLREVGFRSYVRENASGFSVLEAMVNLETVEVTYEATLDILNRHSDLRGIYVAGGGMEGAIAALREVRPPGKVALIVNEFTSSSRAALADGYAIMVIATPLEVLCRKLVGLMIEGVADVAGAPSAQHFLEPRIVLPEML